MIDVDGAQVHVRCSGSGSPTVVFESGDTADGSQWSDVLPGIAEVTRACAYDRLGTGLSQPAKGCRGPKDLQVVLGGVLSSVEAEKPYIMVGTSGGGYLAAQYVLDHPDHVVGLMLLDTFPAINVSKAPPELRAELKCAHPSNSERRDYAAVEHAAWDNRRRIQQLSHLVIFTNDYGSSAANEDEKNSIKGQQGWLVLNPAGKQVIVTSGHNIPSYESARVITELESMVEASR